MKEAQAYIKNYKQAKFLTTLNFEGDLMVGEEQLAEMLQEYADQQLLLHDVSFCATQMKNVLCNRFTNEAKKHVGKKIDEVPELYEILKAIDIVEKHCS